MFCVLTKSIGGVPVLFTLQERLESGVADFVNAISGGYEMANVQDNLSFRLAHLLERLLYVFTTPERFAFGAGMLTEESPEAGQLGFIVGYKDESGTILQVNMGDIAWSTLILRFGVIGTLLFLALYMRSIALVWRARESEFSTSGSAYLILFLLTTITSSLTIEPHMFAALSMLVALSSISQTQQRQL